MSASGERREEETSIENLKSDTAKVSFKRVPSQKPKLVCAVSGARILQTAFHRFHSSASRFPLPPQPTTVALSTLFVGLIEARVRRIAEQKRLIGVVCHTLFGRRRETIVTRWFSSKRWVTLEISGWIAIRSTARRCRLLILFWTSNCYCHAM